MDTEHARSIALMKFLAKAALRLGVSKNTFVVGGAVRNFILGLPIKDLDIVLDSLAAGKDSEWLARELARVIDAPTNITVNQYGVSILTIKEDWTLDGHDMKGEVLEIANARRESYDPSKGGKGYKPHLVEPANIEDDVARRDYTVNTLLWRLSDLEHGPERAEVLDILGVGMRHLEEGILQTPLDPDRTFSDDPTRMMRAVRFRVRYGLKIPENLATAVRRNAARLKDVPWNAVFVLLQDLLSTSKAREAVGLAHDLGLVAVMGEMLREQPGFASALGRGLSDQPVHLVLDLLDHSWTMKTPLCFLDRGQQLRLRAILLEGADNPTFEHSFVQALRKPPVDQQRLFAELDIPPKERGQVAQVARRLLLERPSLAPRELEDAVEAELSALFPRLKNKG